MWLWLLLGLQLATAACPRGFYGSNCELEGCSSGTSEDNFLQLAGGHVTVALCDSNTFQTSFTISMWARPNGNFSGPAGLFGHGDRAAAAGLGLGYNSKRDVVFGWGANVVLVTSMTVDIWHLYVGIYDATTSSLTLDVDGSPHVSQMQVARYKNVESTMTIGSWLKSGNVEAFWGALDEVRIFQQALTTVQVVSLQSNQVFPTSQLVLYLPMITEGLSPAPQYVTLSGVVSISSPTNSSASLCFTPTVCNPNPCLGEGSICSAGSPFQCTCGPGRSGTTCETSFDATTTCPASQFLYGRGSFDSTSRIEIELCNKPLVLPFSISLWIRAEQDGTVFSYGLGAATLTFTAPEMIFQWNGVSVRGCVTRSSWSNYVISVTSETMNLYHSGALISSRPNTPSVNTTIPVFVLGGGFQGWMSQVRIYRRLININEVRALAGQLSFTEQLYQPDLFLPFLVQDARFAFYRDQTRKGLLDYSGSPSAVRNYNVTIGTQSPTFCRARAVDVCDPHPCNFGTCVRSPSGFECKCFDRYIGPYCNLTNPKLCSGSRQAVDGCGQFGNNASLVVSDCGLGIEDASFTVSAWVHRDLSVQEAPVVTSSGGLFFGFRASSSESLAYFEFGFASTFVRVYCAGWTGWKHFVGTFDWKQESQSGTLALFVDGKKVIDALGEATTSVSLIGVSDLRVGASSSGWFNGFLSDVRVFNRRVTDSEVVKLWDSGAVFAGLQVHLPLSIGTQGDMSIFGRGPSTVQRALTSASLRTVVVDGDVSLTTDAPPLCISTSPCFPNPCEHGACVVAGISFECLCDPSYSGPTCTVFTNRTMTCLSGATSPHGVFNQSNPIQIGKCQDEFVLNSFTFSGWYLAHSLTGTSAVLGTNTMQPRFGLSEQVMQFGWNASLVQYPSCKIVEWVHFAGVYDAANASLSLWVNGELVRQSASGVLATADSNDGFLWVGYNFNGRLSQIRYHKRSLLEAEILSLFMNVADDSEQALALFLPLTDNKDYSPRHRVISSSVAISSEFPLCFPPTPCFPNPCDSGTCVADSMGVPTCACLPGFYGPTCKESVTLLEACLPGQTFDGHAQFGGSGLVEVNGCAVDTSGGFTISLFARRANLLPGTLFTHPGLHIELLLTDQNLIFSFQADNLTMPLGCEVQDAWVHIAASYNTSTNTMKLYSNEILHQQLQRSSTTVLATPDTFEIGRAFIGSIDDVRFFERELTSQELQAIRLNQAPTDKLKFFLPMGSVGASTSGIFDASSDDILRETMLELSSIAPLRVSVSGDVVVSSASPLCYKDLHDPCFPNPCLNGVCSPKSNSSNSDELYNWLHGVDVLASSVPYQCTCFPGYWGPKCDVTSVARPCFPGAHLDNYRSFVGSGSYDGILAQELNNAAFAISFWARVDPTPSGPRMVISHESSLHFEFGDGQVRFGFSGVQAVVLLGCQTESEWHHYTGTVTPMNAFDNYLKLYVDGKLMATEQVVGWFSGTGTPIQIGSGFVGDLDDIRISKMPLSDADVYHQFIMGEYTNLRLWVPFGTSQNHGVINEATGAPLTGTPGGAVQSHSVPACFELRVIPGSLAPVQDATYEPGQGTILVANSSASSVVQFEMTLTALNSNGLPMPPVSGSVTEAWFYAGAPFDKRFDCLDFVAGPIRGGGGAISITCTLPDNTTTGGAFLQFMATYCLWPSLSCSTSTPIPWNSSLLRRNKTTFHYPYPTITPSTLQRLNDGAAYPTWVAKNLVVETFQFSGTNFIPDPSIMRVTYGPISQPDKFLCEIIVENTTATKLVFRTSDQGFGVDLVFQVNVAGAKVVGTDMYYYPTVPVVSKVEGCPLNIGASTFNCPTVGDVIITITGTGFFYENGAFNVFVGEKPCNTASSDVFNSSVVRCLLPPGGGLLQSVSVQSLRYFSVYVTLVNFAAPKITSLSSSGCNNSDPARVTNCPREGGNNLTITGSNFGESGAVVLIGTSSCGSVVHLSPDHTVVTCILPPGHQLDQPVLLIVYRGEITKDPVTLSYKQCPQGQYEVVDGKDYPCAECKVGSFSPAEGAIDSCTPCLVGRYSIQNASTVCVQCDPGRFQALEGKTVCGKCDPGRFAGAPGQAACEECLPGKFQAGIDGQNDCSPCQPGKVQPLSGKASCSFCGEGTTNNAEFKQCLSCESGSVAPQIGAPVCSVCPPKSFSSQDRLICECDVGMYGEFATNHSFKDAASVICQPCPTGAACTIRPIWRTAIPALPGYWHISPDALHFEPCLFIQHCPGQLVTSAGNDTGCGANRGGLLCANCLPKFKSTGGAAPCDACPESAGESWGWSMLFVLAIFAALAVVYAIVLRADAEQDRAFNGKEGEVKLSTLPPILSMGDASVLTTTVVLTEENQRTSRFTSTLKILVGFFQISTSLAIFDDVKLPSYYSTFVGWFDVINLDFVPWTSLSCVANFNFFTKTLLTGFIPMLVIGSFTAGFFGWYKIAQARDFSDDPSARKKRKVYRLKFWKLLLFTLFLLYPSVSRSLLRYFVCRSINFESYLLADLTMVCGPGIWLDNLVYAVLFVLVYPIGIPAIFFYLMWRRRKKLRRVNTIQTYSFLYQAYIEKVWFFEEVEMIHKLTMTSILQFFPGRMRFQAGMIVTYLYTTTVLLVSPYVQKKNEILAVICEVEIMLLLLAGNAMSAEGQLPVGSFLDILLSMLLIMATLGAFFLFIATSIHHARQNYWNKKRLSAEKHASERRKRDAENSTGESGDESYVSSVTFGDSTIDSDESDEARASFKPSRKQQEDMQNALQSTFSEQIVPFWVVLQESIENIWDHLRSRPCCQRIMKVLHRGLDPAGAWCSRGWDAFVFACSKLMDLCHCASAGAHCRRLACVNCCRNRQAGKPKQYTTLMLELMLPEKRTQRSASEYTMRPQTDTDESDSSRHSLANDELSQTKLFKPAKPTLGAGTDLGTTIPKKATLKPAKVVVEDEPLPPPPPKKRPTDEPAKPLPGPPPRKPKKPET